MAIEGRTSKSPESRKVPLFSLRDRSLTAIRQTIRAGGAGNLASRWPRGCRQSVRSFRGHLRGQVSQDRQVPSQGPRPVPGLLRRSGHALALYPTTNHTESTSASFQLRRRTTRNYVRVKSAFSLMNQYAMSAQKQWWRLCGFRQLTDCVAGVKSVDEVDQRLSAGKPPDSLTPFTILGNSSMAKGCHCEEYAH